MSLCAVHLTFEFNDITYFDTVIVKKSMARKLTKYIEEHPNEYFYDG